MDVLRLSPQSAHTAELITLWRAAIDGELSPDAAHHRMAPLLPDAACDGYWHGEPGMALHAAVTAVA